MVVALLIAGLVWPAIFLYKTIGYRQKYLRLDIEGLRYESHKARECTANWAGGGCIGTVAIWIGFSLSYSYNYSHLGDQEVKDRIAWAAPNTAVKARLRSHLSDNVLTMRELNDVLAFNRELKARRLRDEIDHFKYVEE